MRRKWKMCVAVCLILSLLPVPVHAENGNGTDVVNVTEQNLPVSEVVSQSPGMMGEAKIDAAVSERADSNGDADLPSFLQDGVSACGIDASQVLSPETATAGDVANMVRPIIYINEVGTNWQKNYGVVTRNDNGHGISAGILQWNATNALMLLKSVVQLNPTNAQAVLGADLYNKILTDTSWDGTDDAKRYIPTEAEALAIGQLLAGEDGTQVQNSTADTYIYEYITMAFSTYGITNASAIAYFCDLKNQCGVSTVKRIVTRATEIAGSVSAITLNELHQAALMDSIAGKYQKRRYMTYQGVADGAQNAGWNYHPTTGYRIPSDTVSESSLTSEVMWLQAALNTVMGAGLVVDGAYGIKTQEAIRGFQTKYQSVYGIDADGYAGRQTITALITVLNTPGGVELPQENLAEVVPALNSAVNTTEGVELTWGEVTGADGYYIYRRLSGATAYEKIGQLQKGKTVTYTDKTVKSGKTYTYTVRAYNGLGLSSFVADGITVSYLKAPAVKGISVVKKGMKVKWKKVAGADGYYVYRKVKGGAFKKIATIKSGKKLWYIDTTGKANKNYTYVVYAYQGSVQSACSDTVAAKYVKLLKYKTKSNLNYRSGAGTRYAKAGTLKSGKTVYVVKNAGVKADGYRWAKIYMNEKFYYVAKKYLKKCN